MTAAAPRTRSKAEAVSLVLLGADLLGILLCLAWSLYLRRLFILDYRELGGEIPLAARVVVGTPWPVWILGALAFIALLVAKKRLRRRWLPPALNAVVLPALALYAAVFTFGMFTSHFYIGSGTWEDDPGNWYRAFREEKPVELTVVHSKYWNSAHFTAEFIYFFEIKASPEWREAFLRKRELVPVDPSQARSFRDGTHCDLTPDWFAPDPVSDYDVWDRPGYHGSVYIHKTTGHIHFQDA